MNNPFKNASYRTVETLDVKRITEQYINEFQMDVKYKFENINEIEIRECSLSGLRYYYPNTTEGDKNFYRKLLKIGDYSRLWEFDHEYTFNKIEANSNVLEIGCGSGQFLKKLKLKNIDAEGIELNDDMVDICLRNNLKVSNELLSSYKLKNKARFNVICVFQVLEHIYHVQEFMEDILYCLKEGGKIFISTPNNHPYYAKYHKLETLNLPPHHMTLWNLAAFRGLSSLLNLELISHCYSIPTSLKGDIYYHSLQSKKEGGFFAKFKFFGLIYSAIIVCIKRSGEKENQGNFIIVELNSKIK